MLRVGIGYDSHRFAAGRALILGGVRIPHEKGLAGHSDADAVLHAVIDAVLGAMGAPDIGEMFPDDAEQWTDADSGQLLRRVVDLAVTKGCRTVNCDVTVLTEAPRLVPHKPAMRQRIADILNVSPEAVSIKAKTNEGMGFVGRGEGLAAIAAILLDCPEP